MKFFNKKNPPESWEDVGIWFWMFMGFSMGVSVMSLLVKICLLIAK